MLLLFELGDGLLRRLLVSEPDESRSFETSVVLAFLNAAGVDEIFEAAAQLFAQLDSLLRLLALGHVAERRTE